MATQILETNNNVLHTHGVFPYVTVRAYQISSEFFLQNFGKCMFYDDIQTNTYEIESRETTNYNNDTTSNTFPEWNHNGIQVFCVIDAMVSI